MSKPDKAYLFKCKVFLMNHENTGTLQSLEISLVLLQIRLSN